MTKNDRFREAARIMPRVEVITSAGLHFILIGASPSFEAGDISILRKEIEVVTPESRISIPPPPEAVARPAVPVVSASVALDVTLAKTTFENNPASELRPPPEIEEEKVGPGNNIFSIFEVMPRVQNSEEISKALEREYPAILKDAGIGGEVIIHFEIDELGKVTGSRVAQGSGYAALDEAALRVAPLYSFSPALNRDKPVRVRVAIPVTFRVRRPWAR